MTVTNGKRHDHLSHVGVGERHLELSEGLSNLGNMTIAKECELLGAGGVITDGMLVTGGNLTERLGGLGGSGMYAVGGELKVAGHVADRATVYAVRGAAPSLPGEFVPAGSQQEIAKIREFVVERCADIFNRAAKLDKLINNGRSLYYKDEEPALALETDIQYVADSARGGWIAGCLQTVAEDRLRIRVDTAVYLAFMRMVESKKWWGSTRGWRTAWIATRCTGAGFHRRRTKS